MAMSAGEAAIVKGMLARGDKQQWIAAWFGGVENSGRISNIAKGYKHKDVKPAPLDKLPPQGPYVSASAAHRALVALLPAKAAIDRAVAALTILDKDG